MSAPMLQYPNLDKEFYLERDASKVGLGAKLLQYNEQEIILLPVSYASRPLKKDECNYSTTDLEGLAVV